MKKKKSESLSLPPWLYLPTNDYDHALVAAQDAVSRMSPQEKAKATERITDAFERAKGKL